MKHVVKRCADEGFLEALLPIGREVVKFLGEDRIRAALGGARLEEALPAPNAWITGGYGPNFDTIERVCRFAAGVRSSARVEDGYRRASRGVLFSPRRAPRGVWLSRRRASRRV